MSSETPVHSLEKFVLRLPDGMREKIGVAARANKRTMNAEIIQRLEASFSSTGEPLLVINKNTAEADIIFELRDSMQSLEAKIAGLDRFGDVLQRRRPEVADLEVKPRSDLPVGVLGKADSPRLGDTFESRRDIDPVAHQVAVGLLDDVAQVNADAKNDLPVLGDADI